MTKVVQAVQALRRREEAQTMAEYAVIMAVITLTALAAFTALSGSIATVVDTIVGVITGA